MSYGNGPNTSKSYKSLSEAIDFLLSCKHVVKSRRNIIFSVRILQNEGSFSSSVHALNCLCLSSSIGQQTEDTLLYGKCSLTWHDTVDDMLSFAFVCLTLQYTGDMEA